MADASNENAPAKDAPDGYEQNMWHSVLGLAGIPFALMGCVLNGIDTDYCLAHSADLLIGMTGGCAEYSEPADAPCSETNEAALKSVISSGKLNLDKLRKEVVTKVDATDGKRK
jgi:hypothetical protein